MSCMAAVRCVRTRYFGTGMSIGRLLVFRVRHVVHVDSKIANCTLIAS
jgi:hypothetical protein